MYKCSRSALLLPVLSLSAPHDFFHHIYEVFFFLLTHTHQILDFSLPSHKFPAILSNSLL